MATPFWQQLVINAIGPLVTVIGGSLIVGLLVASVTRQAQERREQHKLRGDLVREMTESATMLHLAVGRYFRAQERDLVKAEDLAQRRDGLDDQYDTSRTRAKVLENRLRAYFATDEPRHHWHAVIDLLTVRYYRIRALDTPKILRDNAGPQHSGLSFDDLQNPDLVRESYNERLAAAVQSVLAVPLRGLA